MRPTDGVFLLDKIGDFTPTAVRVFFDLLDVVHHFFMEGRGVENREVVFFFADALILVAQIDAFFLEGNFEYIVVGKVQATVAAFDVFDVAHNGFVLKGFADGDDGLGEITEVLRAGEVIEFQGLRDVAFGSVRDDKDGHAGVTFLNG